MTERPAFTLSSGDLIADRRFAWAKDCEAKGDLAGAADLFRQTADLAPGYAPAWFGLGEVCEKLGRSEEAIDAYRKSLAADPQDRHGAGLRLARADGGETDMSRGYVESLFDGFAPTFDRALTKDLAYRGPEMLRTGLLRACESLGREPRFARALDLGCGSGLAGITLRPLAAWLEGVDLSAGMLREARKKAVYDRLEGGDMLGFLGDARVRSAAYDLIVAADVFVYVRKLDDVLAASARVLAAGGLFAFTTETHDGTGTILRETLRFAHSSDAVKAGLEAAGLTSLVLEPAAVRNEKRQPVPGLLVVAAHDAASVARGGVS
ncbi:MAG: methyltransferase [Pseudorhodoplanes sp.]